MIVLITSTYSQAQNQEIQKVVGNFFEAFHANVTMKSQSFCDYTMILQSISESAKGTKLSNESPQAFFKTIGSIPKELKFQEKILSYAIQLDGSMAHAWTPYEFFM